MARACCPIDFGTPFSALIFFVDLLGPMVSPFAVYPRQQPLNHKERVYETSDRASTTEPDPPYLECAAGLTCSPTGQLPPHHSAKSTQKRQYSEHKRHYGNQRHAVVISWSSGPPGLL